MTTETLFTRTQAAGAGRAATRAFVQDQINATVEYGDGNADTLLILLQHLANVGDSLHYSVGRLASEGEDDGDIVIYDNRRPEYGNDLTDYYSFRRARWYKAHVDAFEAVD